MWCPSFLCSTCKPLPLLKDVNCKDRPLSASLSFLDRTNIGNARLDTLEKDLEMEGLDYNVGSPTISSDTC
jgi:hypothetical protein